MFYEPRGKDFSNNNFKNNISYFDYQMVTKRKFLMQISQTYKQTCSQSQKIILHTLVIINHDFTVERSDFTGKIV